MGEGMKTNSDMMVALAAVHAKIGGPEDMTSSEWEEIETQLRAVLDCAKKRRRIQEIWEDKDAYDR